VVLCSTYVSWILWTFWIQSDWGKQCSLVTLRVPGLCGTIYYYYYCIILRALEEDGHAVWFRLSARRVKSKMRLKGHDMQYIIKVITKISAPTLIFHFLYLSNRGCRWTIKDGKVLVFVNFQYIGKSTDCSNLIHCLCIFSTEILVYHTHCYT
jgi:hypothetical protein